MSFFCLPGRRVGRYGRVVAAALFLSLGAFAAHAQTCPFDDGNSSLTVEGVILTRYALGITGVPLVASTGIAASDAPTVEAAINCPSCGLNITGNPTMTVADATIISRKLAGFNGAQLTDGLSLGSGTRNTPAAVQSFLLAGCGATGGTVTSITAGAGLTGGTITGSGTIAVNTSVIQNRVSGTCAVGSSIRAIAADGTVTCQTDAVGGVGTVTNVATGLGLSGGPVTSTGTIAADTTYLQRRVSATCAVGSSIRVIAADGTVTCQIDNGGAGGGGTVTSVATGSGLTGGPIIASGTINLATTQLLPIAPCAANQIAKWTGAAWVCAADEIGGSGTVTSVDTGAGLTGGPVTSAGTIGLAATQLLPTTACANNQIPKWNGSVWTCATEAAGGAGTVTGVLTGIGLTGGPITTTGTVNIQSSFRLPQTCTADQMSRWNGSAWVCTAMPPLPAPCSVGQSLTLTSSGELQCTGGPTAAIRVDSVDFVGPVPRIATGTDGFPVISYYDRTNFAIKVAKCSNAACSGANSIVTVAPTGGSATQVYSSIAVPADGRPVISYHDVTNTALMFVRCANAACSGVNTAVTLDNTGFSSGLISSIAISSADGFPVISYGVQAVNAGSPNLLRVYKCSNADCTAGTATDVDAPVGVSVGLQSSIVVPADGLPVISYWEVLARNLRIAKCNTASCAGVATITLFDAAEESGNSSSIAIGSDGLPVVAYTGGVVGASTIKVLKCATATCASGTTTLVDSSAHVTTPSMTVPADGLPIISYYDQTNTRLKTVKCGNASCSASNTFTVVDAGPNVGQGNSIAMSADGLPVIAYYDEIAGDLKVYKCANAFCRAP